jgi:mannose-6-phosphate isomerase-like protein (cupin superfamily)
MKHIDTTRRRKKDFTVLATTRAAQAAMMVLPPGESTGEVQNEHAKAEQWLYVVSGVGRATIRKRTVQLKPGSLLLIEKGEPHQVRCTGKESLVTLNLYAPPAYNKDGEVLFRAKSWRDRLTPGR